MARTHFQKFRIELITYRSYRRFLADVFEHEKSQAKDVTLRSFAKAFGLSAPAFQMILAGSRNLTVNGIHRVSHALRLNEDEMEFFEALVLMDQAKTDSERNFYQRRVAKKCKSAPTNRVRTPSRLLVSRWYVPAFLIHLIDIARVSTNGLAAINPKEIKTKFGISQIELEQLLKSLEKSGLLTIDKSEQAHIVFDKVSNLLSDKRYLEEVLAEAGRRLQRDYGKEQSHFLTHTFTVPKAAIPALSVDYKRLLESYMTRTGDGPDDDLKVVQAAFQLFPC